MNLTKTDVLGIALFLALGSCVLQVKAEVRLGAGVNCGIPAGDGVWEQTGRPHETDHCGESLSLQFIGNTSFSWLDYMFGISYRKGTSVRNGEWLSDDCYASKQTSGGPIQSWSFNIPECDARFNTDLVENNSRSLSFAFVPTYRTKDFSLFTSLGVVAYDARTKVVWNDEKPVCSYCGNKGVGTHTNFYQSRGYTAYFDIGMTYKRLFATLYYIPHEHSGQSADSGNYGVIAGIRF